MHIRLVFICINMFMNFGDTLNDYLTKYNISGKDIAKECNISPATISRLRNNHLIPDKNDSLVSNLSIGLYNIINKSAANSLSSALILDALNSCCSEALDYNSFIKNFNFLLLSLSININKMSKYMNYDPSYISRIRNGQRVPSDTSNFISKFVDYIYIQFKDDDTVEILSNLLHISPDLLHSEKSYKHELTRWLCDRNIGIINDSKVSALIKSVNDFNIIDSIDITTINDFNVLTPSFSFSTSRTYYGIDGMREGELDFLKSTILSKSTEDIILYNDMPMKELSENAEFSKKFMLGISFLLKKGHHIKVIHNINRPISEMIFGLESWIPLYMTGQVSPYYIRGLHNSVFSQANYCSSSCILFGDSMTGHHSSGKYYVSSTKKDIEFYTQKCKHILEKSSPLMSVYNKDNSSEFNAFLLFSSKTIASRKNLLSVPPLYTMSPELLDRILLSNNLNKTECKKIRTLHIFLLTNMKKIIESNDVYEEFPQISQAEFNKSPLVISSADAFLGKTLRYTYETYVDHFNDTKKFCNNNPNYQYGILDSQGFINLQIRIIEGKWVILSKNNYPEIHFVITNPFLLNAISDFILKEL